MTTQRHDFDPTPFTLEELPHSPRFVLRVRPAHRAALAGVLGLDLPDVLPPLWLPPDEKPPRLLPDVAPL